MPRVRGRRSALTSPTSTRSSTPTASPRARSSTTTKPSPRCCLPHLQQRPLTLKRYPNGVEAGYFTRSAVPAIDPIGSRPPSSTPARATSPIASSKTCRRSSGYQLASLELHTPGWPAPMTWPARTMMVCSTRPRPRRLGRVGSGWAAVAPPLDRSGLESVVKTSGSKGLQLYVPLNTPVTYAQTSRVSPRPGPVAGEALSRRGRVQDDEGPPSGKVSRDWSQNDQKKTTVCVYSLRPGSADGVDTDGRRSKPSPSRGTRRRSSSTPPQLSLEWARVMTGSSWPSASGRSGSAEGKR